MKCPYCNYFETKVVDSRPTDEGQSIRRRRECGKCEERFTTYERVEKISVMVEKRDGSRQPYNRHKVLRGIIRACEKRPISVDVMESIVDNIEKELQNSSKKEITTNRIGEMVMERIKAIDEVAYVRFASVYKKFKDINSFLEELQNIIEQR